MVTVHSCTDQAGGWSRVRKIRGHGCLAALKYVQLEKEGIMA